MKRIRRLLLAAVIPSVIMGTILGGALSAPALADTGARPLTLTSVQLQFTSFACLNPPSCSLAHVTVDGKGTSNLSTGAGSFHADLTVDSSPGGTCNIADESSTFTFDNGMIFVHSNHEDCATHGLRIDTTFQVTGGTGAFQGATGSGREFSSAGAPKGALTPAIYVGTISF
jgi:hypothetical protein